jgi:WG repeat protein
MKTSLVALCLALLGAATQGPPPAPVLPDLIPYMTHGQSGELWGYADPSGRLVIPAQFDEAEMFAPEGFAWVKRAKRWGLIDRQGKELVPAAISYHVDIADGLAGGCVETDKAIPGITIYGPMPGQRMPVFESKCGYFDRNGKVAIPFQYDWIHPFSEGVAAVSVKGQSPRCTLDARLYGLIDTSGKYVLQPEYCYVGASDNGWIRVVYENHGLSDAGVGFVDRAGRQLIAKLPYEFAADGFRGPLLPVRSGGLWGFVDRTGREVVAPRYDDVSSASDGLARVRLKGKYGFVDASGKLAIPLQYDVVANFDNGIACVNNGGKNGFIDRTGKLVIEVPFDREWSCRWYFSEGLLPASQNGKWGYVDRQGRFVIAPRFDEVWGFSEGLAAMRQGELWGFIDQKGTVVIAPQYFRVDRGFTDGLAYVTVRDTEPCCPNIYRFSVGFLTHQGKEFFDRK